MSEKFTEPTPHFRLLVSSMFHKKSPVLQQWWVERWDQSRQHNEYSGGYGDALTWPGEWRNVPTAIDEEN
jgi:hypothetical protein